MKIVLGIIGEKPNDQFLWYSRPLAGSFQVGESLIGPNQWAEGLERVFKKGS